MEVSDIFRPSLSSLTHCPCPQGTKAVLMAESSKDQSSGHQRTVWQLVLEDQGDEDSGRQAQDDSPKAGEHSVLGWQGNSQAPGPRLSRSAANSKPLASSTVVHGGYDACQCVCSNRAPRRYHHPPPGSRTLRPLRQPLACSGTADMDGPWKQKVIYPLGEETRFRAELFHLCSALEPFVQMKPYLGA